MARIPPHGFKYKPDLPAIPEDKTSSQKLRDTATCPSLQSAQMQVEQWSRQLAKIVESQDHQRVFKMIRNLIQDFHTVIKRINSTPGIAEKKQALNPCIEMIRKLGLLTYLRHAVIRRQKKFSAVLSSVASRLGALQQSSMIRKARVSTEARSKKQEARSKKQKGASSIVGI